MAKVTPISILELPEDIVPIYKRLIAIIKKEREIKGTEYGLIATLATQYYLHQNALNSIINDGVVLVSTTNHGTVEKANPQVNIHKDTGVQIQKLSSMLVMTQKEIKALMNVDDEEEDEDDPLAQLSKRRAANKEKRNKE